MHYQLCFLIFQSNNTTHVDDLELQDVESFAELRIGSLIGLGVPLLHAKGEAVKNDNFVFLQLCHSPTHDSVSYQCVVTLLMCEW